MESLRLHRCCPADLRSLQEIARETFCATYESDNDPQDFKTYINNAFSSEALRSILNDPASLVYFIYQDKSLAAYFQLNSWTAQSDLHIKNTLELQRIYIRTEFQGKGMGKWILEGIRRIARGRGVDWIWLGVWEKNKNAIEFYRRCGFRKFGEHPFYIGQDRQTDWLMRMDVQSLNTITQ